MPAPLPGAGYLRPPVKSGTKEEVLARVKAQLEASWRGETPLKSKAERHAEQGEMYWARIMHEDNLKAASRPSYEICGPHLPPQNDDRLRDYRSRYGRNRND